MPARSLFAKDGVRIGTLGSLASLAFAFPLAEGLDNAGAHTDISSVGFYASRASGVEHLMLVVKQLGILRVGFSSAGVAEVKAFANFLSVGTIETQSYFRTAVVSTTVSATITAGLTKFTGSTPGQILTLSDVSAGAGFAIRNAASVNVIIAAPALRTIEGATSFVLYPGEAVNLHLVGTDWTVF